MVREPTLENPIVRQVDPCATESIRVRYGRIAPIYDVMESLAERRYRPWRERFWELVRGALPPGGRLLEVGVGTGKNFPYWPPGATITAIDLTPGMLQRARRRAERLGVEAQLDLGDVQELAFPDSSFDIAAATFVFCSVPNAVLGLRELRRVVRPGGAVVLMEHVLSANPLLSCAMNLLNPIVVRITGANINRHTVTNVEKAGLRLERVENLGAAGIFKLVVARVPD